MNLDLTMSALMMVKIEIETSSNEEVISFATFDQFPSMFDNSGTDNCCTMSFFIWNFEVKLGF